jgi:hypothetical protein
LAGNSYRLRNRFRHDNSLFRKGRCFN